MRRSTIWFLLAFAWGLDCLLALFHRNWMQAGLTVLFAACFFGIGLFYRKREHRAVRREPRTSQ